MTLTDTEITDARGFLCAAIENPFFDKPDPDHPINRWLRCVAENFPLWTFQTEEFLSWGEAELPSTYPLERIIDSVFRDEGLERYGFYHGPPEDIALLENVYARRMELGREERSLFLSCFYYETADGSRRMEKSDPPSLLSLTEPPRLMDWDDDGPIGSYSVYEEIGRELVGLIRGQNEAEKSEDRSAAKAQLDAFLEELGAKLPAHRKSADPPEEYLRELFTQGRDLLSLLWVPLDELHTSPLAIQVLSDAGADTTTHSDWALRLAVPALSWAELQAVKDQHQQAVAWTSDMKRPTARRLAIWMLARRLGSPPARIANKIGAGSDWDYFNEEANPVDAFAPGPMS